MLTKIIKSQGSIFTAMLFMTLMSCENNEAQTARVEVALVDAPADYEKVLIDVVDVQINVNAGETVENGWQSLNELDAGVYDLLTLTNGEEVFLGEIDLPEGQLGQIRLVLGNANQLVINGETHDLKVPSGSESGLKLQVNEEISAGVTYKLILDFDVSKSVVEAGNSGMFNLKPVIRAEMEALTGSIQGVVSPVDVSAIVYAISGEDSVSTYPDENGEYLVRALEEGIYEVVAVPDELTGLQNAISEGVAVEIGKVTLLDTLKLTN